MSAAESADVESPSASASGPAPRRRLRLRFGLRFLFVLAILFCLASAWVGRNVVRMREEEAAIEALMRANAQIVVESGYGLLRKEEIAAERLDPSERTWEERAARAIGWKRPPRIVRVRLRADGYRDEEVGPALAALRTFPDLSHVELHGRAFDDRALREIATIPSLESLTLEWTKVTPEGIASLASHEGLRALSIDVDLRGEVVDGVASLKELRSVELAGMPLDEEDLAKLASLPNLEELSLVRVTVWPDSLRPLEQAKSLERLTLEASAVLRGSSAVQVPSLPRLERLEAGGLTIAELPPLPRLERLDARLGMEELPALPNLEQLDVFGLTDQMLATWDAPPRLRHVALYWPITPEAARDFRIAHPDCAVTYRPEEGKPVHYRAESLLREE